MWAREMKSSTHSRTRYQSSLQRLSPYAKGQPTGADEQSNEEKRRRAERGQQAVEDVRWETGQQHVTVHIYISHVRHLHC